MYVFLAQKKRADDQKHSKPKIYNKKKLNSNKKENEELNNYILKVGSIVGSSMNVRK